MFVIIDEERHEIDNILIKKSQILSNLVEDLNINSYDFEIPLNTTKEILDIVVNYKPLHTLKFNQLCQVLLLVHFLQIDDIYKACCVIIAKKIRYKKPEEIIDLFEVNEKDREKILNNPEIMDDLILPFQKNH